MRSLSRVVQFGFLFVLFACQNQVGGLGIHLNFEKHNLSNGLTVLLIEDHTVPIVSYQTWVRVGSVDEQIGKTGISHLFEHLMFKGTAKYGAKQFFNLLETRGAEVNAFTTRDYTVYYENIIPDLLEKVIDMESDRLGNLVVTKEVLDSERLVVLEERGMRNENSPEGKMQEALWQLAYHSHPYGWPVIGYPQDLISLDEDSLNAYFKKHYLPSNATLVVSGDFQPKETLGWIQKYYGKLPYQRPPQRNINEEYEQKEERRLVLRDKVSSERFSQAYHVTSARQDDTFALDVLANILFEGKSSRAHRKLIDELDILVDVSGSAFTPTFPGLFIVNGLMKQGVSTEKGEQVLSDIFFELQEKGVTREEIEVAVKQLTVQMVDTVRTPFGIGQLMGTVQVVLGDPKYFAEDLGKYLKVTESDVQRVAKKYLIPNNRSVVKLVPEVEKAVAINKNEKK